MYSPLSVIWVGRLALRRLVTHWRSLLTVIIGALLSASVGALMPLYTAAVAQVSLVERLNQLPLGEIHALASLALIPAQMTVPGDFSGALAAHDAQFRDTTRRLLEQPFPGWVGQIVFYGETSALALNPPAVISEPGAAPRIPDPTTRVFVAYYQDWEAAVSLIDGRLPADTPADPAADIEIVIPFEAQNSQGISIGDVLELDQGGPRGGWPTSQNVRARVVGIASPPEQLSPFGRAYFLPPSPLRYEETRGEYSAEFPVLATRAAFERVATRFIPDTPTRFGWRLLFDHRRLPFSRSAEARAALLAYQNALVESFRTGREDNLMLTYRTRLIDWQAQGGAPVDLGVLLAFERGIRSLDAPFGLLLLQVGGLVIFFLMSTAALVRRGERREIAMLQSRGATDRSLTLIRGAEALAICLLAALLAPVLSQQLLIAITPFFARYPDLPLLLTPTVFVYAAGAAAVAFLALMTTLRPVLRLPLVSSGGLALRGERQPWWQRYYVDVALALLGIAALLRLVGRDTPLFTTTAGGSATDPFLLLAPALLFLGMGSVLLRIFPAVAAAAARFLAAGRGLVGTMATWQLSREPLHYGRITFLLALAIGIGWFATSFRATVNRSQTDQAQYRVGTDARFIERDMRLNASRARDLAAYTATPGVEAAAIAWRRPNVNFQSDPTRPAVLGTILAIDAETFVSAVHWRPDLGVISTPGTANRPLPERGQPLPFVPQRLGLWAKFDVWGAFGMHRPDLDRLRNRTTLYVRLLDGAGAWLNVPFSLSEVEYISTGPQAPGLSGGGAFLSNGWAYFETDLSALSYQPIQPVRLVSLYWQHRGRGPGGERFLRLMLAGLSATDAGGTRHALDLFRAPGWEFAYDSGALSEGSVAPAFADERRGPGLVAQWDQSAESARVGLLLNYPPIGPVPMIASQSLIARLGVGPGQMLRVRNVEGLEVQFALAGAQSYYPSLYDAFERDGAWVSDFVYQAFAIVDRDSLLYALNRRPGVALYPDEVWLKAAPGADPRALLDAVRPTDRSATLLRAATLPGELENLQTDPLSRGLLGLMLLAFIVAMALSVVGLLTYAALTASARRVEFGVLRALGLSPLRVIGQLALEQIFVIALGVLLGAALGAMLSSQVVPRLAQDASGTQITPPFIVQAETAALVQYGAAIAAVIILVLCISLLIVRQLSVSRTLRLGED